jgi:hypothetical protein
VLAARAGLAVRADAPAARIVWFRFLWSLTFGVVGDPTMSHVSSRCGEMWDTRRLGLTFGVFDRMFSGLLTGDWVRMFGCSRCDQTKDALPRLFALDEATTPNQQILE